jgi:hypothetical protein
VRFSTNLIPVGLQSVARKDMPKRNRVAALFMLPFAVFTFLIGWCMCWTGTKKGTVKTKTLKIK